MNLRFTLLDHDLEINRFIEIEKHDWITKLLRSSGIIYFGRSVHSLSFDRLCTWLSWLPRETSDFQVFILIGEVKRRSFKVWLVPTKSSLQLLNWQPANALTRLMWMVNLWGRFTTKKGTIYCTLKIRRYQLFTHKSAVALSYLMLEMLSNDN
jgi:hypothetical protein